VGQGRSLPCTLQCHDSYDGRASSYRHALTNIFLRLKIGSQLPVAHQERYAQSLTIITSTMSDEPQLAPHPRL